MDLRKLKTLIDLVSESNVSELEITEAEGKVRIVKSGTAVVQQFVAAPVQQAPVAAAAAAVGVTGRAGSAIAVAARTHCWRWRRWRVDRVRRLANGGGVR